MAFPVATTATTSGSTAATNKACNLPASIAAGDLLILLLRSAGADTHTTPTGWSDLVKNNTSDASDDTTSIFYKEAAGTEGTSVTVNGTASLKFASLSWRITGAADATVQAPQASTVAVNTTTTPDPTSLSPTGGAKDYLWLWVGAWDGEQTSPPASNPTNYTGNVMGISSGTAGLPATNCQCASASRNNNIATEDPPSWTISGAPTGWSAWTVAVHPAPPIIVAPGVGSATWTGVAPSAVINNIVAPGVGSATWAGLAPIAQLGLNVLPGVGVGTWAGIAPTVITTNNITVTPSVGAATWTGVAPTVLLPQTVTPGVGQATWTGIAPTAAVSNNVFITPGVGAATWTGLVPTVLLPNTITTGLGQATWAGLAPMVVIGATGTVILTSVGAALWSGLAPAVIATVSLPPIFSPQVIDGRVRSPFGRR